MAFCCFIVIGLFVCSQSYITYNIVCLNIVCLNSDDNGTNGILLTKYFEFRQVKIL